MIDAVVCDVLNIWGHGSTPSHCTRQDDAIMVKREAPIFSRELGLAYALLLTSGINRLKISNGYPPMMDLRKLKTHLFRTETGAMQIYLFIIIIYRHLAFDTTSTDKPSNRVV